MNNFYYSFPAIKGKQADRDYFVIMCPLSILCKLFIFTDDELPPDQRSQRVINKSRIPEMASYIVDNPKDYVFSSLTASIDGDFNFNPNKDFDEKIGLLKVSMDSRLLINDGQHRRAAIEEALKNAPSLSNETISVVLFVDEGLKRSQQIFADLNKHAVTVSKSIGILYDSRDTIALITKSLIDSNKNLKYFTDKENPSLSKFSPKLFTLSNIYETNKKLLTKLSLSDEEAQNFIFKFWDVLSSNMVEWNFVFDKEMKPKYFRDNFVSSNGVVLEALGLVGNYLYKNYPDSWCNILSNIKTIDWNRENLKDWQNRAIGLNGRIVKSTNYVRLTNNLIKMKLNIPLTAEEKKLEKDYKKTKEDKIMKTDINLKINEVIEEMKIVYKNDKRPWIIGYSGGKDSTVVVQLAFTMLESLPPEDRHKPIYVVSSDTLIENPIVLGYLKEASQLINEGSKAKGLPLYAEMVHPDYNNTFWTNIIGKGLPTPTSIRFRWCTERLKIKPSNIFIEEKVKENGEVIVLLGVRKSESIARKIRIENRAIDGYLLTPHGSLQNTYVYNPIVDYTTDDVWKTLLSNNGVTPWGGDNNELFALYAGSDAGECPFTITKNDKGEVDSPSCGNSRFGCWICTVVKEDKSLTGFIKNGEDWLMPLLDFRSWLLSIRDKHEYRQQFRRDGNHYYKKLYLEDLPLTDNLTLNKNYIFTDKESNKKYIDLRNTQEDIDSGKRKSTDKEKVFLELLPLRSKYKLDESKIFDKETKPYIHVIGYGPFNFFGRKEILRELLRTQLKMNEFIDFPLITIEELEEIDKIWDNEEDLTRRSLVEIYYEIMKEKLPWHDFKKPIFDTETLDTIQELNKEFNLSDSLINKLLIETNKAKHFTNKTVLDKSISKVLNQRYLHKSIVEEIENDN